MSEKWVSEWESAARGSCGQKPKGKGSTEPGWGTGFSPGDKGELKEVNKHGTWVM